MSFFVSFQKLFGQHHVADPKRRHKRLGKGVKVYYPVLCVLSVQRKNKFSCVSELAVVIVFDNVAFAYAVNPSEKLYAPPYRHDDTRGEVIGRGDMNHIGSAFLQGINAESCIVNGDILPRVAEALGNLSEFFISGVFNGEGCRRSEKL